MAVIVKQWWQWLTELHTPLPDWIVVVALSAGAFFAVWKVLWVFSAYISTWVHEAGHVVASTLTGGQVRGVKVKFDRSGCTEFEGNWFSHLLSAHAGYTAPPIVGGLVVLGVLSGRYPLVIAALLALFVLLLPLQRSFLGWVYGALLVAGLVGVTVLAPDVAQVLLLGFGGFLIVASFRNLAELSSARNAEKDDKVKWRDRSTDPDALAKLTLVPAVLWEVWFFAVSALAAGAAIWATLWWSPAVGV